MFRFLLAALVLASGLVADPLASRVLVVYAANSPDSVTVANYYAAQRGIPSRNLCGITLANTAETDLNWATYISTVRTPVRNCLNAAGKTNILYLVLAYVRPFRVIPNSGLQAYAMDSYLADLWDQYSSQDFNPYPTTVHRYYADNQSQGNVFIPFVSLADYRTQPRSQLIYSVWRLDGATPAAAMGLVDKATQAMANGVAGGACIDLLDGPIDMFPDYGNATADWDLHRAAGFFSQAGIAVTEDQNEAEFGTAPAPLRCDNTGFYAGWYSYQHYNDAFTWVTGAIGFHLDSASMMDPRGNLSWSANALSRGITATSGSVAEPYLEGLTRPGGFFRNLFEGANIGDAFLRNVRWLKWMLINVGDPLYRPFATPMTFQAVNSLALSNRWVLNGGRASATLTLASPAPAGGVSVPLSSVPAGMTPSSVSVSAGSTTATFQVNAPVTSKTLDTIIQADTTPPVKTTLVSLPLLGGVVFLQPVLAAGQSATGQVFLNGPAPQGGVSVQLSTDNPALTVPASVFIQAGTSRASFRASATAISANALVTVQAVRGAESTTGEIIVTP